MRGAWLVLIFIFAPPVLSDEIKGPGIPPEINRFEKKKEVKGPNPEHCVYYQNVESIYKDAREVKWFNLKSLYVVDSKGNVNIVTPNGTLELREGTSCNMNPNIATSDLIANGLRLKLKQLRSDLKNGIGYGFGMLNPWKATPRQAWEAEDEIRDALNYCQGVDPALDRKLVPLWEDYRQIIDLAHPPKGKSSHDNTTTK